MADDKPVIGYSMTGVPITKPKRRIPKQPWWIWTLIVLGVLMVIGAVLPKSGTTTDPVIKQNYPAWRAECEARATDAVAASDGLYVQGGNHWVSLVNSCLMTKANDAP